MFFYLYHSTPSVQINQCKQFIKLHSTNKTIWLSTNENIKYCSSWWACNVAVSYCFIVCYLEIYYHIQQYMCFVWLIVIKRDMHFLPWCVINVIKLATIKSKPKKYLPLQLSCSCNFSKVVVSLTTCFISWTLHFKLSVASYMLYW